MQNLYQVIIILIIGPNTYTHNIKNAYAHNIKHFFHFLLS